MGYLNPSLRTKLDIDPARAERNALVNQRLGQGNQIRGQQIEDYPADRNYLLEQRQRTREQQPILDERASDIFLRDAAKTFGDYNWYKSPAGRERLVGELGIGGLPTFEEVEAQAPDYGGTPEGAWEGWKERYTTQEKPEKWSAPKEGVDETGKRVMYQVNDKGESRIVSGISPKAVKGMKFYDRETGNLILDMSGGEGPDMTRKTKGTIEGKIIGGKEQLARMQTIYGEFKPEYLEIGTRLKAAWTGIKAKLGKNVSREDAKALTGFKKFQRKAIENINLYIKELTGAQMSEKEADRLRLAQPDPGENWWSGDDPITFKAKMDDVMKFTRAAVARYEFYRSKGLDDNQIKAIINSDTGLNLEEMASKME